MPRLEPLPAGIESEPIARVFDRIRERGDEPSPLYRTLAHAPNLLEAWAGFANALRYRTALERSVSELVIMRLAQLSGEPYQWAYHWQPALKAGLSEAQLRALDGWAGSDQFDTRQKLALGYAEAMVSGSVTDAAAHDVRVAFGARELVELTLTVGFYVNVGRVLQALDIEVDASRRPFLP